MIPQPALGRSCSNAPDCPLAHATTRSRPPGAETWRRVAAWLERLLSIGIVSTDPDIVRRQRFVNVASYVPAFDAFSHLIFNAVYDF